MKVDIETDRLEQGLAQIDRYSHSTVYLKKRRRGRNQDGALLRKGGVG